MTTSASRWGERPTGLSGSGSPVAAAARRHAKFEPSRSSSGSSKEAAAKKSQTFPLFFHSLLRYSPVGLSRAVRPSVPPPPKPLPLVRQTETKGKEGVEERERKTIVVVGALFSRLKDLSMRGPPTGAFGYTLQCAIKKGKSDKSFRDSNHRVQVNEAALSLAKCPSPTTTTLF